MIDGNLLEALKRAAAGRPELSESAVIRQALRGWFEREGVKVRKSAERRAGTRRPASKRQQR
jgi:hypothetical protein